MITEQVAVVLDIARILEGLDVEYALGGSFASAVHGVVRATNDADVVAGLAAEHVDPLIHALGDRFYAEAQAMHHAIQDHGSFNVIHLNTMFKVDVFIAKPRRFDRCQLERRQAHLLSDDSEQRVFVSSAEDTVIAKLEWYRKGGEISDRQWQDVIGILKVQMDRIDRDYLRRMCEELGVADLLKRALVEARTE